MKLARTSITLGSHSISLFCFFQFSSLIFSFTVYLDNLVRVAEAQRNDPGATYKINKVTSRSFLILPLIAQFFDMSPDEFRSRYMMPSVDISKINANGAGPTPQTTISCLPKGVTADVGNVFSFRPLVVLQ